MHFIDIYLALYLACNRLSGKVAHMKTAFEIRAIPGSYNAYNCFQTDHDSHRDALTKPFHFWLALIT